MKIRTSTESDLSDVLEVEERAFGSGKGAEIAGLVSGLLSDPSAEPLLSLLAVEDTKAIGHILFTRARIAGLRQPVSAAILAPLAVIPDAQGRGVGGQLIEEGLRLLSESGVELVFVLGHPGYYPRHGFRPAGTLGFQAPHSNPDEPCSAWMVRELRPGAIGSANGKVICADALNQPRYWRE